VTDVCVRCSRRRDIHGRGLCWPCYRNRSNAGVLHEYPTMNKVDRLGPVTALVAAGITDRQEIAARLGCSINSVDGALRRLRQKMPAALPVVSAFDQLPPWPDEPTPCKDADPELFFPSWSGGSFINANRDQIEEALSYCDRCPLASKRWCEQVVRPKEGRISGVAGGRVYIKGRPQKFKRREAAA
jgi:hypothetical protein